ncbi:M23 family metallopeptidase (plasmid) [Embleya sp. NBC_00888]|uniref:M23 family metallopeptidase n=1 Tax=Embleya sp. NBC_00888 TaxID=2975960 RepID=UPI002F9121E1|nr:M23 family metallopeptidase [Embleya sp. NBC_00888]
MPFHKAATAMNRLCWIAFFAVLVAGMYYGYSWMWSWVPLGLMMVTQLLVNWAPDEPDGSVEPDEADTAAKTGVGAGVEPGARPGVEVEAPVSGRWRALNSPADKVPSHGTRAYGQAYAIDIVAEPEGGRARPRFGWWPVVRRSGAFPGFGLPVSAVADATVVRVVDGQRDHLSRNSFPALVYLVVEGVFREVADARRLVGNHVILDPGDGVYAMYAHLRRGSVVVREGERVRVGQELARCGNSGNSSEPHVHFQLMDAADPTVARGIPFTWRGIGVPSNDEVFSASSILSRPGTP